MTQIEIDGKQVFFVRADGTFAENSVGYSGEDQNTGELMFFEICDKVRPILDGKELYQRIIIRRVFPVVQNEKR